jgi:hypothetical protein
MPPTQPPLAEENVTPDDKPQKKEETSRKDEASRICWLQKCALTSCSTRQ